MSFVTRSVTRYWVLAVLGALALFALLVILGDSTASATLSDGDVVLGAAPVNACNAGTQVNCTNSLTGIVNTASGGDAFHGFSASGTGVGGFSTSGTGVTGQSSSSTGVFGSTGSSSVSVAAVRGENSSFGYGVYGQSSNGDGVYGIGSSSGNGFGAGVHGIGSRYGVYAQGDFGTGLYATTQTDAASGNAAVFGLSEPPHPSTADAPGVEGKSGGTGVMGVAGVNAAGSTGVLASNGGNGSATALKATGKTSFSRSGKLTVAAGSSSATKSAINLSSTSMVLATIQGNQAGVYVQGVTQVAGTSGSFTIHLSKNTTANLPVAWFIVN
jgi:hypothetical protein